jgi:hypothetical protein
MGNFLSKLKVRHLDGENWEILEEFSYHVGHVNSDEVITVPKGFVTDFASIPRICWSLIGSPTGKYGKAAVIHDWLYRKGIGTRKRADDIFLEGMEVLNISRIRRIVMYIGVRIFGFFCWKGK